MRGSARLILWSSLLVLGGLSSLGLMRLVTPSSSSLPAEDCPQPDEESMRRFSANPIQYHLIPRVEQFPVPKPHLP